MGISRAQLQTALQKPYDRLLFAKEVLSQVFNSGFTLNASLVKASVDPNSSESDVIDKVGIYGKIQLEDGTDITCYEILLQPKVRIEYSKVAIQHFVRKLLTTGQAALISFVSPINRNAWRLTLIAKDSFVSDGEIKEKATNAKRYTFLLGPSESCKTAAERFESLAVETRTDFDAVIRAFSVERLSKAFFDEYTEHYNKFVSYLTKSTYKKTAFNGDEKAIRDFTKKLLGRIVFLYFVQKKGWLGASDTNYTNGMKDFVKELFVTSGGSESFYSVWLTRLFFETLNSERSDDNFEMPHGNKVKIPFLNGGLFEKEKQDEYLLTFKPKLFHNPDNEDDPDHRGFLDFLNAFNFTIYEDSPDEKTIAVDPEMLGHIFENLLEDNKDKGAFYTPKEIVHYMCQESLIEYLTTHLSKEYTVYSPLEGDQIEIFGNEGRTGQLKLLAELGDKSLNRDKIENIVKEKNISGLDTEQLKQINSLLDSVKICDPSIGSGAFPMGLLQEIHSIKEVVAYETKKEWKPAEVKEHIIQNSIYGVDIEKGAVDIARLRFWLSLVVDEERPKALPNLDYKIVVGNSLVSKLDDDIIEIEWNRTHSSGKGEEYLSKIKQLLIEVSEKQREYFNLENRNKHQLSNKIRELKIELLINQVSLNKLIYINKNTELIDSGFGLSSKEVSKNIEIRKNISNYNILLEKLGSIKGKKEIPFNHFDWKLDFPEVLNPYLTNSKGGFDIVIANPPYIKEYTNRNAFDGFHDSTYYQGKMDIWYAFACIMLDYLKNEGIQCLIAQNNWITSAGAAILRDKVLSETEIKIFTDFGNYKVFNSAGIQTMIYLLKRKMPNSKYRVRYSLLLSDRIDTTELESFLNFDQKNEIFRKLNFPFEKEKYFDKSISFNADINEKILDKIESKSNFQLNTNEVIQGIVGAPDEAFLILKSILNNFTKDEKIFIKPYYTNSSGESKNFIIYLSKKNFNTKKLKDYPNLYNHFQAYKKELIAAKIQYKTPNKQYFFLHRERDESFFKKGDKIICQIRSERPNFLYTNKEYYASRALNIIKSNRINLKYLTFLFNSKLIEFYYRNRGASQGNILKFDKGPLLKIPIFRPNGLSLFESLFDYVIYMDTQVDLINVDQVKTKFLVLIINFIFYELYFIDLVHEHNCEIIKNLGDLPAFDDAINDKQKIDIINKVYKQLSAENHPVNINMKKMRNEIEEIKIIEGEE